jgi:hypothetical protein
VTRNQRIALAEADLLVRDVAILLGYHAGHITNVLSGRYKSPKLREKICKVLNKSEDFLWGDENRKGAQDGER